jgi:hypothetical protein
VRDPPTKPRIIRATSRSAVRRCCRLCCVKANSIFGSWSGLPREQTLSLTGPDGLLEQLTKSVLETALS